MRQIIAILGMIVGFFITIRLESWLDVAQRNAAASFVFRPYFLMVLGINLLIALLWFILTWWVVVKVRRSWLLVGVLPLAYLGAPVDIRSYLRGIIGPFLNLPFTNMANLIKAYILVMGIYLIASPWLRRSNLPIAVLPVFLFILPLAACQTIGGSPSGGPGAVQEISLPDGGTVHFPRLPEADEHMTALLEGQLILDDGCLRATTEGYEETGFLVLWSADATAQIDGRGTIEVLDGSGAIVARVGEPISIGGGAMESQDSMRFWEQQIEGLPIEGCPGPYWVAGEMNLLDQSTKVCTQIGCMDTLEILFTGGELSDYTAEITDQNGQTKTARCNLANADTVTRQLTSALCTPQGVTFYEFAPSEFTLTVTWDEGSIVRSFEPSYEILQPNGQGCPPACRFGSVVLDLATVVR